MEAKILQINKKYKVNSPNKGKFSIKLIHCDETYATGIVINGMAKAILPQNEAYPGDKVTLRREFTQFFEIND